MSDRQTVAESGVGLCLAGLAPWAAPLAVPVAVLGALFLDLHGRCDQRLARNATDAALTGDHVPLDWAFTKGNLAIVEIAYFDKTAEPARLVAARNHALAAREVFVAARTEHYAGMADAILAQINERV